MFAKFFLFIALNGLLNCVLAINNTVWNYHLWLDPRHKYSLKWNVNTEDESITFLCEVETRGWIGLGISPNGGMKDSDIVIGWVNDVDGLTHFHDRYAFGESLPQIDESEDWVVLDSRQNSTHTMIKFSRPLISCDKTMDRDITRDTIRVVYAFGDKDPTSESDIRMHGRHQRGAKSVLLLGLPDSHEYKPQETDLQHLVLNVNNITIDKKETTYWCKIFKISAGKMHVVKFGAHITPGNEAFTHHISLDACLHPNSAILEQYLHEGADCTDTANMPQDFLHCFNPYFMWATGGGDFLLPQDVGFPLGEEESDIFVMLNIHYDNPQLIEGVIDSSGLEFYYTPNVRKYEAFTLSVGSAMDSRIFIPPNQKSFHITGHCHTDCFENKVDPDGLKLFAVWPHGHTIVRKIKVRHFRGNEELPWIEFDQNYDFNLQSFRSLDPMVKMESGDQITVECEYDSTHRNKTVMGGLGTYDEMCTAFFYYYPRMTNSKPCLSGLSDETIRTLAGIPHKTELTSDSGLTQYLSQKKDWNQTVLDMSYEVMLSAKQKIECYWFKTDNDIELSEPIGYPEVKQLYKPIERQCLLADNFDTIHSHFINVSMIAIIAIIIAIIIVFVLIYFRKRIPQNHNRLV